MKSSRFVEALANQEIGQSFRATRDGLTAIAVRMSVNGHDGRLLMCLKPRLESSADLYTTVVPIRDLSGLRTLVFSFPPISESNGKSYYFCAVVADGMKTSTSFMRFQCKQSSGGLYLNRKGFSSSLLLRPLYVQTVERPRPHIGVVRVPDVARVLHDEREAVLRELSYKIPPLEQELENIVFRWNPVEHMAETSWRSIQYVRSLPFFASARSLVRRFFIR